MDANLVTVYRVEHERRRCGPYVVPPFALTGEEQDLLAFVMRNLNGVPGEGDPHPPPHEDGLGDILPEQYCCFTSLEALSSWFGESLWDLEAIGFTVAAYEVAEELVRVGGKQAVFARERSERVAVGVALSA